MIRPATMLALLLAAALSVVLFSVKYQVQELEGELTSLERGILGEQRAIHVLRAEWAHLNDPERLRQLAEKHLNMGPVSARQLAGFEGLAERAPEETAALQPVAHAADARRHRGEDR